MFLKLHISYHHNIEISPTDVILQTSPRPSSDDVVALMKYIFMNSLCHQDYVYEDDGLFEEYVKTNEKCFRTLLFSNEDTEITLTPPHANYDLNDVMLVIHSDGTTRCISIPNGTKYDCTFFTLTDVTEKVKQTTSNLLNSKSSFELAQELAIKSL